METNIQIFKNSQLGEIRVAEIDGKPYFVGKDVATILGYADTAQAVMQHVDEEDKVIVKLSDIQDPVISTPLPPHMQGSKIGLITESGVYALIFGSTLPKAKEFKKWVTSEVLPSIRKHGGYMAARVDETPEEIMARALIVAQATLERQKQRVQELEGENEHLAGEVRQLAPKAEYTDKVLQSTETYTATQLAKELGLTSARALNERLKKLGVQFLQHGQWLLFAKYCKKGYTTTRSHPRFNEYTKQWETDVTTVWTETGRAFLHQLKEQLLNI
jgi:prophage antirepressor-like protein